MKILLIAHEFAPIPSAQSLRWAYLVKELATLGHQVDVLAPDHPGYGPQDGFPPWPASVVIHRTFPGPFAWLLKHRPGRGAASAARTGSVRQSQSKSSPQTALNWKGRLLSGASKLYAAPLFPDMRAEWNPWARRALTPLLAAIKPDVVIASHEPAGTLPLGLLAKRLGFRLVADLGDPVCAAYTARRWRRRALELEGIVCREADLVTVTSAATRELLIDRHRIDPARIHVMTQGFDDSAADPGAPVLDTRPDHLELLYAGNFYSFRRSARLVSAVLRTPGVRLNIASPAVPSSLKRAARENPEAIRLLGFLPHKQVLRMQRQVDALVNLGNDDPVQIPGKIYEYLGAGRPILHIGNPLVDESAALLRNTGAGWSCDDDDDAIAAVLAEWLDQHRANPPLTCKSRNETAISCYAWSAHARALADLICVRERHDHPPELHAKSRKLSNAR